MPNLARNIAETMARSPSLESGQAAQQAGLLGKDPAIYNALYGGREEARKVTQVPDLDPQFQQFADAQTAAAQKYQADAPGLKQQQGDMAQQSSNQALADTNAGITQNANRRGLLYSGVRTGALANAAGASANKMADTRVGINQGIDAQAASLNKEAQQSQMGVQELTMKRNALAYNLAQQ